MLTGNKSPEFTTPENDSGDITMKPENEVSKVTKFAINRSKISNGFKRQNSESFERWSDSSNKLANEKKVERALPPHLQQ